MHERRRAGDEARAACRRALDRKTKPPGSLGRLEELAVELCGIQGEFPFRHTRRRVIVFAGDHGVTVHGVSPYPSSVTAQMVMNFCAGGAAINVLARQFGAEFEVVDVGVASELPEHPRLVKAKVRPGTADLLNGPAMSPEECATAMRVGRDRVAAQPADVLVLGEMGIGNTTSSSALLAASLPDRYPGSLVGFGTGLEGPALERKRQVVFRAAERAGGREPLDLLAELGGFEIAAMVGGFLEAAERRIPVLVDGFIATVAALVACRIDPGARSAMIFAHRSVEPGHSVTLDEMGAEPLLDLGMRLGEGSGAALALGLVESAARILDEMATFDSAGVDDRPS